MFDTRGGVGLLLGDNHDGLDHEADYQLTMGELDAEWAQGEQDWLPSGLEDWEPGLFSAAIVHSVDRTRLNGYEAVRLLQAEARLSAHYEAGMLATVTELAHSPAGGPESPVVRDPNEIEYASYEISASLSLTRRAGDRLLDLSLSLTGRLGRVWDWFHAGRVDLIRVRVFHQQLGHLSEATINMVLDRIEWQLDGLTAGQLRARLARLVMEADPQAVDLAYEAGVSDRKFTATANPDNTGNIAGQGLASTDVSAISRRISKLAKRLSKLGDGRSIDQIRADVFVDLLLGGDHLNNSSGEVVIQTSLTSLVELADTPGELAGYGPVVAEITRQTIDQMHQAKWVFETIDPNGDIVATGLIRRRPTAATRRQVRAQYKTCVGVGCRMPVHDCDLDHHHPYAQGGPTSLNNLQPLCRHHHMIKHHTKWKLKRQANGDHQWTSPLGHTYHVPINPPFT